MKYLSEGDKIDRLCTVIPGCFSVVAALMIALTVIMFKKMRTLTFELVAFQSLSEMIFNLSIIIFWNPPGWLINYGIMSSIFFSGAIAGHMYLTITRRNYSLTPQRFKILSICIVLLSTGIAALPYSTNQYEDLGAQCWLAGQGEYGTSVRNGTIMRFGTHYGLIWLICIFCAWSYVTVIKYVQETKASLRDSSVNSKNEVERTIFRLQYYPAILIFVWLGITGCRFYSSLYPDRHLPNWALGTGHAILNMQGLLNGIVFFSYRSVWNAWCKFFGISTSPARVASQVPSTGSNLARKMKHARRKIPSSVYDSENVSVTNTHQKMDVLSTRTESMEELKEDEKAKSERGSFTSRLSGMMGTFSSSTQPFSKESEMRRSAVAAASENESQTMDSYHTMDNDSDSDEDLFERTSVSNIVQVGAGGETKNVLASFMP